MKHNCLFRPAILTCMVVASCLSVKAYEESNTLSEVPTTPVTISENGSLVTKLTPVWERQLLNDDANQNQMSMAVANGSIYVCVDYYDADTDETTNRKGKIFIRKYDCATGAETTHLMAYPSFPDIADAPTFDSADNIPFIVSDEDNALFLAQIRRTTSYDFDIHFVEINQNTVNFIQDNVYYANATLHLEGNVWMERIDVVSGSIKNGNFAFRAVIGGFRNDGLDNKDNKNYSYFLIEYAKDGMSAVELNIDNNSDIQKLAYPQLFNIPDSEAFLFMAMPDGYETKNKVPLLYTAISEDPIKLNFQLSNHCRGIIPFVHNGQVYAVYAKTNNSTDGSQFQLIKLDASFGTHENVANFPMVPFSVKNPQYKAVQQMAVAKPVAVKNRADAATEATDLYVYAPGSGVGAYRIETKEDTSNGIVPVADADVQVKWINGQLQFGSSDFDGQSVKIYSATGQMVMISEISDGITDLTGLSAGFYVAVTPAGTYKICR